MDYVWPEETDGLDVVVDRPSVGVAFSGGGTRSFVASVGVAQALAELGLLDQVSPL